MSFNHKVLFYLHKIDTNNFKILVVKKSLIDNNMKTIKLFTPFLNYINKKKLINNNLSKNNKDFNVDDYEFCIINKNIFNSYNVNYYLYRIFNRNIPIIYEKIFENNNKKKSKLINNQKSLMCNTQYQKNFNNISYLGFSKGNINIDNDISNNFTYNDISNGFFDLSANIGTTDISDVLLNINNNYDYINTLILDYLNLFNDINIITDTSGKTILQIFSETLNLIILGASQSITDVYTYSYLTDLSDNIRTSISSFNYGYDNYFNTHTNFIEYILNNAGEGGSAFVNVLLQLLLTLYQNYNLSLVNMGQVIVNTEELVTVNTYIKTILNIFTVKYTQLVYYYKQILDNVDISLFDMNTYDGIFSQFDRTFTGIFEGYTNSFNGLFQAYSNIYQHPYDISNNDIPNNTIQDLSDNNLSDISSNIDISNSLITLTNSYSEFMLFNYNKIIIFNLRNYNTDNSSNDLLLKLSQTMSVSFNSIMQSLSTIISTFTNISVLNFEEVYQQFIDIYTICYSNINTQITLLYDKISIDNPDYYDMINTTTQFSGSCLESLGLSLLGIGQVLDNLSNNFDTSNNEIINDINQTNNDFIQSYNNTCNSFSSGIINLPVNDYSIYKELTQEYALSFTGLQQSLAQFYNELLQSILENQ